MALPVNATRQLTCLSCRQWVLRSFIASIGTSSIQYRLPPSRRDLSTHGRRWNEARERMWRGEHEDFALNDINDDSHFSPSAEPQRPFEIKPSPETASETNTEPPRVDAPAFSATSSTIDPDIPWYLQGESPVPPQENVLSGRQRIPDLPEHPPPVLEPLLRRVSVELGMDDLALLDLRGIDPPPALGSNLLMIVGSARSEKHLHFSADKLCRWLRTEHRLTPYADGLLGRQELKLKMKRRAKRSRLMSAVGAKSTADTELDEGIRTGWICVNLGRVEGGELPKSAAQLEREKNVVGFGTGTTGCNIVVQLLTEDKRGEIELERLWQAVLKKSKKEKEALLAEETDASEHASADSPKQQEDDLGGRTPQTGSFDGKPPLVGQFNEGPQQNIKAHHN